MFHALVLGGIALVGSAGCGARSPLDAGTAGDEDVDASGLFDGGPDTGFPSELPASVDAASDVRSLLDAGIDVASPFDAGCDAQPPPACGCSFPCER
jgi:hypothetical protein